MFIYARKSEDLSPLKFSIQEILDYEQYSAKSSLYFAMLLARILGSQSKKEQLHVIDKINMRCFVTTPRNVGSQRDFNRVNIPGKPIDEMEKMFAEIEAEVARVLKEIEETATLPKGTDMEEPCSIGTIRKSGM